MGSFWFVKFCFFIILLPNIDFNFNYRKEKMFYKFIILSLSLIFTSCFNIKAAEEVKLSYEYNDTNNIHTEPPPDTTRITEGQIWGMLYGGLGGPLVILFVVILIACCNKKCREKCENHQSIQSNEDSGGYTYI